jgi:hypothetical protein
MVDENTTTKDYRRALGLWTSKDISVVLQFIKCSNNAMMTTTQKGVNFWRRKYNIFFDK